MPEIHLLFRFRDLVAPTIEEHQRIITERGWCWWGWWKRPSEDSRGDIWDDLARQIGDGKTVEVGLFDSGSGTVHRALVTGVKKPAPAGDDGVQNTIRVPVEEADHVPPYYRESPFSRAWMKITRIDPQPIEFFGYYSFAEAPKLPNYTVSTLRRFANKKISNSEELRGMDTTIWRIRPSLATDPSEQILLSIRAISEPISSEVVQCKSDEALHLTDMHFAVGSNRGQHVWRYDSEAAESRHTMVEAITSALGQRKIGLVIVSGDFSFVGDPTEFDEARTAVTHLLGILDLSADHLVIIPGNHDIQWTTNAVYDHNAEVVQAPPAAKHHYEEFYRQLLRHEPNRHLSMGRRFALPCGLTMEICGINSSSLQTGKRFLAGTGRIDEGAFIDVARQLGWTNAQTLALRVLVIHHHLALTEDLEPAEGYGKGYGLAVDAVRIQRLAAQNGVHLALHGHKHRSFIWRSTVYELPEHTQRQYRLGELSIIGGGSVGSSETEGSSNYFNVVGIKPGKLELDIYRSRNQGAFDVMQEWSADLLLSTESDGLRLRDWVKVR
jgi:3',5'-cyclic AMP phosphodiesterase CpdA